MKRILSAILCLTILLSVFGFSVVNASAVTDTASATEWQEVTASDKVPFNISFLKGFDWCLTSGGEGESNYMNLVKRTVVDSEQVLSAQAGASWSGAYEFSSITGDTVLTDNNWEAPNFGTRWSNVEMNTSSNSVIVYVEIPDYEKAEATWGLGIGHIILDQNGLSYDVELWSADDSREYYYLPVNGDSWQSSTVSIGGAFAGLPSGFKGYIRVDFDNFSIRNNGTSTFDITKDYKLNKFGFTMNAIGNECGNVLLGAIFYVPENDDDTTSMSYQGTKCSLINTVSDELIIKPYNIFNNTQHSINTTPIVADVANKAEGFASPSLWALDGVKISSISGETVYTTDYREMYVPQWVNIKMQPDVDTFMLYVELPNFETAPGLYMYYPQITQSGKKDVWINPAGGEYKYLSEGGTSWESGVVGTYGELTNLYSGFKGYIKFDLKTFAGFESAKENIDFNRVYNIATLQIGYNYIGSNSPLYLGGVYSVLEDYDSNFFTNATTGEVACATVISGDLDQSGEVDASDLAFGRKIALGAVSPHTSVWRRSDIRGTGDAFDIRDLVFLKKKLLGIYLDNTYEILPATAEYDSRLANNPDRGFRLEAYVNTSATKNVDVNVKQWNSRFETAANSVKNGIWQKPKLVQVYFYLTDYKDTETLPQLVLDNIQTVFTSVRNQGQRAIVRFAYQGDIPEYENQASQEIMFKHMEQLAPILAKNKAAICALEAGFLGAWGEWHAYTSNYYSELHDSSIVDEYKQVRKIWDGTKGFDEIEIIKHILDMVPEEVYVQLRTSIYRDMFLEAYPNQGYEKRLGLKNDAFFGYKDTNHAWPYNEMTSKASKSAMEASMTTPMGGEFFWGCEWGKYDSNQVWIPYDRVTAEEAILMYKHFHQSFFSVYHNSFEGTEAVAGSGENAAWFATEREGDMSIWAREEVNTAWLDENKIFYSPSWLVDKNGNSVGRTKYEFVRDHLGYRLEAKNIRINGTILKGSSLDVTLSLQNYGFAPAFGFKSEFVLLDSNNKIIFRTDAGNPAEWHNAAADGTENSVRTHKINAKITLPENNGKYRIAYRVYNSANDTVAFANNVDYILGCNVLYDISF